MRFLPIPFAKTPENVRSILKNLGQNIDIISGAFDEQVLAYPECRDFEMTKERLCLSFSVDHPLAGKKALTLKDLEGEEMLLLKPGLMKAMDDLRADLERDHPLIRIADFPLYSLDVFNECQNTGEDLSDNR